MFNFKIRKMKKGRRLRIQESLDFLNMNRTKKFFVKDLANMVLPDFSESYREKTLYCWDAGTLTPIPTTDHIYNIALICGVSTDYLLGVTEIPERSLMNEEFFTEFGNMIRVLNEHYNTDEHPVLQKAVELWKQRNQGLLS